MSARLAFGGLVAFLVTALAIGLVWEWPDALTVSGMASFIRGLGPWGIAASIGLMVVHAFLPFPAEVIAIANGMVYGPVWGAAITWCGAMIGAFLSFGLARALGRPFVESLVGRDWWRSIDDWTAAEGGGVILISRLFPVIAFNLVNCAAGLSRVSWWTFSWATGIGILPMTVLFVFMGDRIDVLSWWAWLGTLALVGGGWAVVRYRAFAR